MSRTTAPCFFYTSSTKDNDKNKMSPPLTPCFTVPSTVSSVFIFRPRDVSRVQRSTGRVGTPRLSPSPHSSTVEQGVGCHSFVDDHGVHSSTIPPRNGRTPAVSSPRRTFR